MTRSEPTVGISEPKELLLGQLVFYRATLIAKLEGIRATSLRLSLLPSGWTPLELLKHLVFVERRWMQWGFEGDQVPDPWGDNNPTTQRWALAPGDNLESLTQLLTEVAHRTEAVAARHELTERARLGGRFESDPPTLGWILLHLLQEYARHVGQLDIVRELIDGEHGE